MSVISLPTPIAAALPELFDDPTNASGAMLAIRDNEVWGHHWPGVTVGYGQSQAVQAATQNALQAAINYAVANGKVFRLAPGFYECWGTSPLTVPVPTGQTGARWEGSRYAQIIQFNPAVPILVLGDSTGAAQFYKTLAFAGVALSYAPLAVTAGVTTAIGLLIGQCYDCIIEDIVVAQPYDATINGVRYHFGSASPYIGVLIPHFGTNASFFNNVIRDVEIRFAQRNIFNHAAMGTGNLFSNIYCTSGFNGDADSLAGRIPNGPLSGPALVSGSLPWDGIANQDPADHALLIATGYGGGYHGNSDNIWDRINLEACAAPQALLFVLCHNYTVTGLHIEGFSITQAGGEAISLQGGSGKFVSTLMLEVNTAAVVTNLATGGTLSFNGSATATVVGAPTTGAYVVGQTLVTAGLPAAGNSASGNKPVTITALTVNGSGAVTAITLSANPGIGTSGAPVTQAAAGYAGALTFNGSNTATVVGTSFYGAWAVGQVVLTSGVAFYGNGATNYAPLTVTAVSGSTLTLSANPGLGTSGAPVIQSASGLLSGCSLIRLGGGSVTGLGETVIFDVVEVSWQFLTGQLLGNTPLIANTGAPNQAPISCRMRGLVVTDAQDAIGSNLILDAVNNDLLPNGTIVDEYAFHWARPKTVGYQAPQSAAGGSYDFYGHHEEARLFFSPPASAATLTLHPTRKSASSYPSNFASEPPRVGTTVEIILLPGTYSNAITVMDGGNTPAIATLNAAGNYLAVWGGSHWTMQS